MQPDTDRRIDRLERLVRMLHADGTVRGVLWSHETDALLVEIDMERARRMSAAATSSELGHG